MSLEGSTNADSLGILRVKGLDLDEQFQVVTQALGHLGRPYDFDFDFVTDSALVCSELIYKAYQDIPKLSIQLQELNGRLIVSPNQCAQKFSDKRGGPSELEFVLFLDGNEKERIAVQGALRSIVDFSPRRCAFLYFLLDCKEVYRSLTKRGEESKNSEL